MHNSEAGPNQFESVEAQMRVSAFFTSFDNQELLTAEEKIIKLHLDQIPNPKFQDRAEYLLRFEGYNAEVKSDKRWYDRFKKKPEENYVRFSVDLKRRWITIDNAILQNKDLKGKGVYPEIRAMIGRNFPDGFTLVSQILNQRTEQQLLATQQLLRDKQVTQTEAESAVLDNYWVQEWIKAGFNKIRISYDETMFGECVFLYRSKDSNIDADFKVEFNLGHKH